MVEKNRRNSKSAQVEKAGVNPSVNTSPTAPEVDPLAKSFMRERAAQNSGDVIPSFSGHATRTGKTPGQE